MRNNNFYVLAMFEGNIELVNITLESHPVIGDTFEREKGKMWTIIKVFKSREIEALTILMGHDRTYGLFSCKP